MPKNTLFSNFTWFATNCSVLFYHVKKVTIRIPKSELFEDWILKVNRATFHFHIDQSLPFVQFSDAIPYPDHFPIRRIFQIILVFGWLMYSSYASTTIMSNKYLYCQLCIFWTPIHLTQNSIWAIYENARLILCFT